MTIEKAALDDWEEFGNGADNPDEDEGPYYDDPFENPTSDDEENLAEDDAPEEKVTKVFPTLLSLVKVASKKEKQMRLMDKTQWVIAGSGTFRSCTTTTPILPPGMYSCETDNAGLKFKKQDVKADTLIRFTEDIADLTMTEISKFWAKGDNFKRYGYLHRRGYLFYGPQGSGKSSIVAQVAQSVITDNGIVFITGHPELLVHGLKEFRTIEPDRPIVCIFEDIDSIIANYGESRVLSLLDGEDQIDKVLNIATTNYPEKLDKRLVARPRRFDRVVKIGMPSPTTRFEYLTKKFTNLAEDENIDTWVTATDGFSLAALAELVISVKCLGNPFDESVEILKKGQMGKSSSADFNETTLGFK